MNGGRLRAARRDLDGLEGYHSPQVEAAVRLNTNESPYPPPAEFVEAWTAALRDVPLHRYPDREARELRGALGVLLDQPVERLFVANGSNEVIQSLLLAFGGPGRCALVFEPTYALHGHIARLTATEVREGERDGAFAVDPAAAADLVDDLRPSITFLCSPNNPTGAVESRTTIEAVAAAVARAGGLLVVDEAYGEFADRSALDMVGDDSPVVVVKTYSKVWSLAAVRLGFAVAPGAVAAEMERVALPYRLSVPTLLAGALALEHTDEMRRRVALLVEERGRLERSLREVSGVDVWPSGANFILFRPVREASEVWRLLLERGVLVRDLSSRARLEGCLRVTVGTSEENDIFLAALGEVMAEEAP